MFMVTMFVVATAEHWTFASPRTDPDFFTFSGSWDASYYKQIATQGYPTSIPTDSDGNVEQNAWAFLPLYPLIARALMAVTGLGFYPAGVIVAVVFGAVAALLLYRLVASVVGATSGLWAAILFCFGPLSFVLQIAYAESLFFVLMFAALWAAMARRYWLVIPFGIAAAFTKPGALAIPLMLGDRLRRAAAPQAPGPCGATVPAPAAHRDGGGRRVDGGRRPRMAAHRIRRHRFSGRLPADRAVLVDRVRRAGGVHPAHAVVHADGEDTRASSERCWCSR